MAEYTVILSRGCDGALDRMLRLEADSANSDGVMVEFKSEHGTVLAAFGVHQIVGYFREGVVKTD